MAKISYDTHFKSKRADGRHITALAAFSERLRRMKPRLALPEELTAESYGAWRREVKEKLFELLRMPPVTRQEPPVKLSSARRDGYTVEKWEFYPDEYTVVPFLVLIPDGVTRENPAPGVLCLPGSVHSKEFISGEPLLAPYNCRFEKFPERNKMALYAVKNGMVAFAFDNIATAETGLPTTSPDVDVWNYNSRLSMVYGYLQAGICYLGMSTYHMLSFMQYLPVFDFVDRDALAVSAHSLGTEAAMTLGVLCDDIKAIVFNQNLYNSRVRFCSHTEFEEGNMRYDLGFWHTIPGWWEYFDYPDLCAAIAPKYLAFNEGSADEWFNTVRRAYAAVDAEDRLQIGHYPKYADAATRTHKEPVPRYGLDNQTFYDLHYNDAPEHSYKKEPSLALLKKAFNLRCEDERDEG